MAGENDTGDLTPYEARSEDSAGQTDQYLEVLKDRVWRGPTGQVYNANQVKTLLERIRHAASPKLALRCSGIDKQTLKFWLGQGRSKTSEFRDFRVCYLRFRAEAEADLIKNLYSIARHDRAANRDMLETAWPARYRKKASDEQVEPIRYVVLGPDAKEP
jgi:hypothetical protein